MKKCVTAALFHGRCFPLLTLICLLLAFSTCIINPLSFSPDGRSIVCATTGAPSRILKVHTDGSGYDVLMTFAVGAGDPVWAPR